MLDKNLCVLIAFIFLHNTRVLHELKLLLHPPDQIIQCRHLSLVHRSLSILLVAHWRRVGAASRRMGRRLELFLERRTVVRSLLDRAEIHLSILLLAASLIDSGCLLSRLFHCLGFSCLL